jgi:hypothetical protein
MLEASSVQALLGPTNTGKTHRAMERMLDHPTGMIGLPLRLLAREVYDRVTARVGGGSGHDGGGTDRLFHAYLLVGADPDCVDVEHAGSDACVGPH